MAHPSTVCWNSPFDKPSTKTKYVSTSRCSTASINAICNHVLQSGIPQRLAYMLLQQLPVLAHQFFQPLNVQCFPPTAPLAQAEFIEGLLSLLRLRIARICVSINLGSVKRPSPRLSILPECFPTDFLQCSGQGSPKASGKVSCINLNIALPTI